MQVPVWVPIMVGLFGLFGALAGQAIAGWQHSRRQKAEAADAERSWHREQRVELYAEFARAGYAFFRAAGFHGPFDDHAALTSAFKKVREASVELNAAVGRATVVAPGAVVNPMLNFANRLMACENDLWAARAGEKSAEDAAAAHASTVEELTELNVELLYAMRVDLGVDPR